MFTQGISSRLFRAGLSSLVTAGTVAVGVAPASASPSRHVAAGSELTPLVGLAAERILLADKVAAAKFGTDTPIEDPEREQQVLDQAKALAIESGLDTRETVEFFRAQIEMSKVVQQGLYELWTEHPELAPKKRPDLATEVRPELDRITGEFIDQLATTENLRGGTLRCRVSLVLAEKSAAHQHDLDRLHERALRGAVEPVCADY
ncbi:MULTISPECIES: gamma subclass chorismate mutase AroQ [unclassified Streptomyces]|uniref:gamma subclass chorismate mutase AroQ n=1 Tax=unclassified Streptomyces TaxID=2593676 RepID=UPI002DDA4434|nr:gamma subclass chorismate mutase AroQ [Streptomyces sp. NBC_01775]WSB79113.1 gamma subclass chorismate mutase AroQ [Streptomyces sp. NBC_01775]WSS41469.1 gamma subclass chorismate mutase AroQ [Streptomyces sp. NBC_01187]